VVCPDLADALRKFTIQANLFSFGTFGRLLMVTNGSAYTVISTIGTLGDHDAAWQC
jgi:hypothetical protein